MFGTRKEMSLFKHFLLILSLVLAFISSGLSGQKKVSKPVSQHEVIVTLKLVQVYVTDKKGHPVTDLSQEDFILYDNGKKQKITDFERYIHSFLLERLGERMEIIAETQAQPPRHLMNRKFFFLFDFAHNNPNGVMTAKKAALHFLEAMVQPTDEIGILSYSPARGLAIHEYLTTDHKRVKEFIALLGLKDALGNVENLEAAYWEEVLAKNPLDASKAGGVDPKEEERLGSSPEARRSFLTAESRFHALSFIKRLVDLAKALRYIPGIKYILLFSSGIPYSLIYGIQAPWGLDRDPVYHVERRNYGIYAWGEGPIQKKLEEMHRELANSNTVVYTFDTEDSITRITLDTRLTGAFTLQQLASSTGGKYFGNIRKYDQALEEVQQLTGCYYVLGYYVDEKWDGKYHEIRVEVKRPGLKIHAQRGYFNPRPFKEWTDLEKKLHLVDLALSERPLFQTPLPLRCGGFSYVDRGKEKVVLWAEVMKEKMRELTGGEVELVFLVFDGEGNMVKMERRARAFDLLPEDEAIYFSSPFALASGDYRCRVVLRSLVTGRGAVGLASVFLGAAKEKGPSLSQPLLLAEGRGARYENLPSFLHPFDLKSFSPLSQEVKRGMRKFYALLSYNYPGTKEPAISLYGHLLLAEGERIKTIPLSMSLVQKERDEAKETYLIKVETDPLEPGSYYLYFHTEEVISGFRSMSRTPLQVIN